MRARVRHQKQSAGLRVDRVERPPDTVDEASGGRELPVPGKNAQERRRPTLVIVGEVQQERVRRGPAPIAQITCAQMNQ